MKKDAVLKTLLGVSSCFLLLAPVACGKRADTPVVFVHREPMQSGDSQGGKKSSAAIVSVFQSAPVPKQLYMPAPTLLTPRALEEIYRPIFGAQPRWRTGITGFFAQNPTAFFTPRERLDLGETHVSGPSPGTLVDQPTQLTTPSTLQSNYLVALRTFATDACRSLLSLEMNTPESGSLVHTPPVQPEKVNAFLARLVRRPAGTELFRGVSEYTAATNEALQEAGREENAQKRRALELGAWHELCVALATDPRVYIR